MRVLVVEDDPGLGAEVADGLRAVGYAVDLATNLADAGLKLSVDGYDCLVLDRLLPDGDGLELLRRQRAAGVRLPVLMLTAVDAVAEDADDYLLKPFAFAELAARVGALCRRAEHPRQAVVRIGDLELDTSRKRVRRGGVLLTLGAKEFAVLELLAVRAGQVVSRADLLKHCRDEPADPLSTVVDEVIAQLRRKLGPPIMIGTVRDSGYVIEPRPAS
ncbi:MAG: DNA-binding response regulator [Amycolatopsis sp.]|jgi:DNA-binding response OmpR family regulator|uniref:response regulator transcription factor n=1 Tax=Amycolatopsis sp. TaxID=37632 RepID=UPI00260ADDEE|nr:response regulator transcription factor [Amycolatopsis sp.]MCU1684182.1 DNA-binding response regulator [Amycolatopsis sp.]